MTINEIRKIYEEEFNKSTPSSRMSRVEGASKRVLDVINDPSYNAFDPELHSLAAKLCRKNT